MHRMQDLYRGLSYPCYKTDMKKISKKRRNDLLLLGGILLFSVIFGILRFSLMSDGEKVNVIKNGEVTAVYSLKEDLSVTINGENGWVNELVIKDKKAYVSKANCPDKICAKHRPVKKSGETIVCLPHRLVIEIE